MQKQTVSTPAALVIILVAVAIFFILFNKPVPEKERLTKPMPLSPQIDEANIRETRQGLLPLGIHAVFPPLYEDRKNGVRVARVMQKSSTTRAGLRPGDLITDINDTKLISADHLIGLLTLVEPDQTYTFKVVRTELDASGKPIKKTLQLNVTGLTPLPPEEQVW